ncbi:hypothetical protein I5R65_09440 [Herbaspirillum sp. AP02]|uniref:hypothetical protein n=1 Tax=unclassified Herbaspirillum TaxID=2624150 RepID=UPI0015D9D7D1|nr:MULTISPECIES: hypothetical protein [unclassified Herbaspirillum]MBG7619682.1 hypothetical protein [Herbaspirillum sp. AP02]NZD69753.1 hypothetical protein [Herbaspirillum sp. AP21]
MLRRTLIALSLVLLGGCTAMADKSQKFAQPETVIDAVVLTMNFGDISKIPAKMSAQVDPYQNDYVPALKTRVPATFENNGIRVLTPTQAKAAISSRNRYEIRIDAATFSQSYTKDSWVHFDLLLWDRQLRKKIWAGRTQLSVTSDQPLLRSEKVAGDILNSLNREGLIQLKQGYAVDARGERITDVSKFSTDR